MAIGPHEIRISTSSTRKIEERLGLDRALRACILKALGGIHENRFDTLRPVCSDTMIQDNISIDVEASSLSGLDSSLELSFGSILGPDRAFLLELTEVIEIDSEPPEALLAGGSHTEVKPASASAFASCASFVQCCPSFGRYQWKYWSITPLSRSWCGAVGRPLTGSPSAVGRPIRFHQATRIQRRIAAGGCYQASK